MTASRNRLSISSSSQRRIAVSVLALASITVTIALWSTPAGPNKPAWWLWVLFIVTAIAAVFSLLSLLSGWQPDSDDAAARLASGDLGRRLVSRWIARARWARNVGAIAGLLTIFIGSNASIDPLVASFTGLAVGALFAELHLVKPQAGERTASLEVRNLGRYVTRFDSALMTVAAGLALALAAVGTITANSTARTWGIVAVAILGVAYLVQQRVARRPRSGLDSELTDGDDLVRRLAVGPGIARPAAAAALACVGAGATALVDGWETVGDAISFGSRLAALAIWFFNRRLGLNYLRRGGAVLGSGPPADEAEPAHDRVGASK